MDSSFRDDFNFSLHFNMRVTQFGRLVNIYRQRLISLFHGKLPLLIENPGYVSNPKFQQAIWDVAASMAVQMSTANASSWRTAVMKGSNARQIHAALQREIQENGLGPIIQAIAKQNAELISSVPLYVARQITERAAQLQIEGKRPEVIAREMRKALPHLAKTRIDLIARTEIGKAETALTQVRAQRMGLNWFEWLSSSDARVRKSHKNMNGVLMSWDDLPNPEILVGEKSNGPNYAPGGTFNCRCFAAPLADLNEVKWPHRVFRAGSITVMSRAKFSKIAGLQIAA